MRPQGGAVNQMGVGMTERWRRLAGLFALIAALTFAVAACGGGDDEGSGGTTTEASGAGAEKTFPEFKIAYEPIDYMDPGLSYSVQGWGIMWNVYLGLLTYKHVDGPEGAELIQARRPTPFERTAQISCPIQGHFGETDQNPTLEDMAKIDAELTKHGKAHEFYVYKDTGHSFMDSHHPDKYVAQSDRESWARSMEFLKKYLAVQ